MHEFPELLQSPHVRVTGKFLYHGEWKRHSISRRLIPHGEGVVEFPVGYGYAADECTLHVEIVRARNLVIMNPSSNQSDPYAVLECNGFKRKTKIVFNTLEPAWGARFEIPVSDPDRTLKVTLYEKNLFVFRDAFMGGVEILLSGFEIGKEYQKWYKLEDFEKGVDPGTGQERVASWPQSHNQVRTAQCARVLHGRSSEPR